MDDYGYCPKCGRPSIERERRPNGNDRCEAMHVYPSRDALREPPGASLVGKLWPGEQDAIDAVLKAGATYGYGNMILRLREAWREHLIAAGLDAETASYHTRNWGAD